MRRARFLIVFFVLLALFETPLLLPAVDAAVVQPITTGIAAVSGRLLHALGEDVTTRGMSISGPCFSVEIKNGCNALEATLFLVAAILAFPAPWKEKLAAVGIGVVLLQILNLARVVSLYWIGCHQPAAFETFHTVIWQTVIFGATIGFFMLWSRRAGTPRAA